MGRPQPKLGLSFSHITRKFTITEPYSEEQVKKEEEKEVIQEEEMILTLEDQIQLKTAEDLRARVRQQTTELLDHRARLDSQLLLLKLQLVESLTKSERKKAEVMERLREIKRECEVESRVLEDGEIVSVPSKAVAAPFRDRR